MDEMALDQPERLLDIGMSLRIGFLDLAFYPLGAAASAAATSPLKAKIVMPLLPDGKYPQRSSGIHRNEKLSCGCEASRLHYRQGIQRGSQSLDYSSTIGVQWQSARHVCFWPRVCKNTGSVLTSALLLKVCPCLVSQQA